MNHSSSAFSSPTNPNSIMPFVAFFQFKDDENFHFKFLSPRSVGLGAGGAGYYS